MLAPRLARLILGKYKRKVLNEIPFLKYVIHRSSNNSNEPRYYYYYYVLIRIFNI